MPTSKVTEKMLMKLKQILNYFFPNRYVITWTILDDDGNKLFSLGQFEKRRFRYLPQEKQIDLSGL